MGADLDGLRASMTGLGIDREDPNYDEARKLWNASIDGHPAVIAPGP